MDWWIERQIGGGLDNKLVKEGGLVGRIDGCGGVGGGMGG